MQMQRGPSAAWCGPSSGDTVAVRGWFPRGHDQPQAGHWASGVLEDPLELQGEGAVHHLRLKPKCTGSKRFGVVGVF